MTPPPGHQHFVTSYNYDAPLTEAGDSTDKYEAIRETLLGFYTKMGVKSLPKRVPDLPKVRKLLLILSIIDSFFYDNRILKDMLCLL